MKVGLDTSLLPGRGLDDGGEIGSLQAGAADEGAIDLLLAQQLGGVVGLHTAAVLDPDGLRRSRSEATGDRVSDHTADTVCFVCRADFAGADGPDRLVGQDE